ncbi:MAG: hypothetical protein ABI609_01065 [Acidobacteriota bacterium]
MNALPLLRHQPSQSIRRPRRRSRPRRLPEDELRVLAEHLAYYETDAREVFRGPDWREAWRKALPAAFHLSERTSTILIAHGACFGCGCTDDQACDGGCYWLLPGWCSACGHRLRLDTEGE